MDAKKEKKATAEMLGEFGREAAVLVLVFGFLDDLVKGRTPGLWLSVAVLGVGVGLLAVGVIIERMR